MKNFKYIFFSFIFIILSLNVFANIPLTGEEYVKKLNTYKPSTNIKALLEDTEAGTGYVEVRGRVINIFEFGSHRFFTLHFENSNSINPIDYIYINMPEDTEKEDFLDKNIACILKWDLLSINQDITQTIQLNQSEHYDIELFSYLEAVTEYESQIKNKSPKGQIIQQFGKPSNFVMPVELATPEEIAQNTEYQGYNFTSSGKTKIMNIIHSVNKDISETLAAAYADFILTYSSSHGVDPLFVCAIMTQESRFRNSARSYAGAQGLGQLMPRTAKGLGVKNPYDPQQNIFGTTKYLKNSSSQLFGKYPKELNITQLKLLAASYNAGPNAVKRYHGIPPYSETRNYVGKVINYYFKYLNM